LKDEEKKQTIKELNEKLKGNASTENKLIKKVVEKKKNVVNAFDILAREKGQISMFDNIEKKPQIIKKKVHKDASKDKDNKKEKIDQFEMNISADDKVSQKDNLNKPNKSDDLDIEIQKVSKSKIEKKEINKPKTVEIENQNDKNEDNAVKIEKKESINKNLEIEDTDFKKDEDVENSLIEEERVDEKISRQEEKIDISANDKISLKDIKKEKIQREVVKKVESSKKVSKEFIVFKEDITKEEKPKKEKNGEEIFENEENIQVIKDVERLNKNFQDVNMSVGVGVFSGVNNSKKNALSNIDMVKKVKNENSGEDIVDGMLYKNLDTVLHESMIPYSEHVILDRALPRVEDGLKPVQRRILYSMFELGITPDKPFRKSARIVGDCLGKYHPHGDSSVYDAMVRMAQPFNTNCLLVSGHGNFGSVDGDSAAAMRYTEARLAPLSMELLRDLDKNTVRWGLNFDDTLKEPEILPGRFPNLLVNGTTGIAVGLATNIPPHNLGEVIDGVVAYIEKPSITLEQMLKIIKGPDFPTGGYVLPDSELKQAYKTGRGKIYLRAKMHVENDNMDRKSIVITEFPYQVNKASLLQKIASFKDENKYDLGDISEVRDESDREGVRAVIKLKKDANVQKVFDSLLRNTELQTTFGINMVAIAGGKPRQMSLMDIISYYTEYQREIIFRRSKYELEQAKEREHILTGLVIAIQNIDAVVKIIKTSQNTTEARKRLRDKFNLSEKQAQAILDMRLARLTSLEVYKLEEELKKIRELITKLTSIINSKKLQMNIVKNELLQIKREHETPRKTKMSKKDEILVLKAESEKEDVVEEVVILKSLQNTIKCVNLKSYNLANKDVNDSSSLFNIHSLKFKTDTSKVILAFTNFGNCIKINARDIVQARFKDKGLPEKDVFKDLLTDETVVGFVEMGDEKSNDNLLFLTKFGMIKKTPRSEYTLLKKAYQAMKLRDGDELLKVLYEPQEQDYNYLFVSRDGMVLKADNSDVPVQGRMSGGVKGMAFSKDDFCVGIDVCDDDGEVLAISDCGFAKRVVISTIDKMARYRKGVKLFTLGNSNGNTLVKAQVVKEARDVVIMDKSGEMIFRSSDLVSIESRTGKGKIFDKTKKKIDVNSVCFVDA